MPEWQKRRTSVWRRVAWSWREAAAAHARKNRNSATYVFPALSLVFPTTPVLTIDLLQTESPSNASIPELERQIDKLTKVTMLPGSGAYAALY